MNITNEQYLALSAQISLILLTCRAVPKTVCTRSNNCFEIMPLCLPSCISLK